MSCLAEMMPLPIVSPNGDRVVDRRLLLGVASSSDRSWLHRVRGVITGGVSGKTGWADWEAQEGDWAAGQGNGGKTGVEQAARYRVPGQGFIGKEAEAMEVAAGLKEMEHTV